MVAPLVASLLLASALPADTTLRALFGTWEITRDTSIAFTGTDGTARTTTVFYESVEISEAALVQTSVSDQPADVGGRGHGAFEARYRYRADGLSLHLNDSLSVRLRPVGGRLGVAWSLHGVARAEYVCERAPPHAVPAGLRGDWTVSVDGGAGIALPLRVRIDGRGMTVGHGPPRPFRVADGHLLIPEEAMEERADEDVSYRTYAAMAFRVSKREAFLDDGREPLHLVRP